MARGNQRDKAREKNQKELSAQVKLPFPPPPTMSPLSAWHKSSITCGSQLTDLQKKKNNVSVTDSITLITAVTRSDAPGAANGYGISTYQGAAGGNNAAETGRR